MLRFLCDLNDEGELVDQYDRPVELIIIPEEN